MDWVIYFLAAGLLPILLFLAVVFLVLGYSGTLGGWITIREGKRRSAVIIGFLCLTLGVVSINALVILIGGDNFALAMAPSSTPLPTLTATPTITDTPEPTIDPLSLVLGTPTVEAFFTNTPVSTPTPATPPLDASRPVW